MKIQINPERLKTGKTKQALIDKDQQSIKIQVNRISTELRKELGIKGALQEKHRWCIYHAAEILEKTQADTLDSVRLWYKQCPEARRYVFSDKASRFYYWLRDEQLEEEDKLVQEAYMLIAKEFVINIQISTKVFKNKGLSLLCQIHTWLGKDCGNHIDDVLIDYLLAVFKEVKKFKPALIQNPSTVLGSYGWSVFIAWIDTEYGGRKGYLLPTRKEEIIAAKKRQTLAVIAELRQQALLKGRLDIYDRLGACGIKTSEVMDLLTKLEAA
jgi:hypothetical protein